MYSRFLREAAAEKFTSIRAELRQTCQLCGELRAACLTVKRVVDGGNSDVAGALAKSDRIPGSHLAGFQDAQIVARFVPGLHQCRHLGIAPFADEVDTGHS